MHTVRSGDVGPVVFDQLPTCRLEVPVCENWVFNEFRLFDVRLFDSKRFFHRDDYQPEVVTGVSKYRNRLDQRRTDANRQQYTPASYIGNHCRKPLPVGCQHLE